jgi:predicted membrane protein (TIGR00267 family)
VHHLNETLKRKDVGPIVRRLFTNTLFDSTFMLLGIVVGSAFASNPELKVVLVTMATSSIALGISTGLSVYESESLERGRQISELERALFRDLSGTRIERSARTITLLTALINFLTPLVSCVVAMSPFILVAANVIPIAVGSWLSIALALSTLFGAGIYMGRAAKKNPLAKGLRMVFFGLLAFALGYLLNLIV